MSGGKDLQSQKPFNVVYFDKADAWHNHGIYFSWAHRNISQIIKILELHWSRYEPVIVLWLKDKSDSLDERNYRIRSKPDQCINMILDCWLILGHIEVGTPHIWTNPPSPQKIEPSSLENPIFSGLRPGCNKKNSHSEPIFGIVSLDFGIES